MEVNLNNYEVFIIDYLDGRLGPVETAQLLLFLENHPGLKEEFEDLKTITIQPTEKEVFGFTELLKQPSDRDAVNLSMLNYQHYFIASIEGDLSSTGSNLLVKFLTEHPELSTEYTLYKSTKLIPDKRMKYPDPGTLRIGNRRTFIPYYYVSGIAAALLLLVTIYFRLTPGSDNSLNDQLRQSIEQQMDNDKTLENSDNQTPDKVSNIKQINSSDQHKSSSLNNKKNNETDIKKSPHKNVPVKLKGTKESITTPIRKIEKKGMIINNTLMSENGTRNFYSDLYDDIRLSQELKLAEEEEQQTNISEPVITKTAGKSTIKALRFLNTVARSGEQVAEQLPESVNGWLFADLGLKGFNFLTNNSYIIDRRYNMKGDLQLLKIKNQEENL